MMTTMKTIPGEMNRTLGLLALLFILWLQEASLSAQAYQEGDIIGNFSLKERGSDRDVSLSEFEGKIIMLEWFTWW